MQNEIMFFFQIWIFLCDNLTKVKPVKINNSYSNCSENEYHGFQVMLLYKFGYLTILNKIYAHISLLYICTKERLKK